MLAQHVLEGAEATNKWCCMQDDLAKAALPARKSTWRELSVLAYPGILNMLSIIVQGIGLQYISASVSQMISGAAPVQATAIMTLPHVPVCKQCIVCPSKGPLAAVEPLGRF